MNESEWINECTNILMKDYDFNFQNAIDLATTFDEEQRENLPREALEEEFSYWGD